MLTITAEKVLKAASESVAATTILKELFPEAFRGNTLQVAIESFGLTPYAHMPSIFIKGKYVMVPLPVANTGWTFAAFDWVKAFCKAYPDCYPVFEEKHNLRFIYINCSKWKDA